MRTFLLTSLLLAPLLCFGQVRRVTVQPGPVAAATASSFTYHATLFSNVTYIKHTGPLTGIANGKAFTCSFWAKMVSANNVEAPLIYFANADGSQTAMQINRSTEGYLYVVCYNQAWSSVLNASCYPAQFLLADGWTHWFIAVDLAATTCYIYKNGTDTTYINSISDATIPLTSNHVYFNWIDNVSANVRISELWFDNAYTASPANWRDGTKPKDLGADGSTPTGSQPKIYFANAYTTFTNNLGSGGVFTLESGTLRDSDSDKP